MEFLWADQWITTVLIKNGARKFGMRKRGKDTSNIVEYQNKIIDLFAKAPWFINSQVKNSSYHSDYDTQFIEETAF